MARNVRGPAEFGSHRRWSRRASRLLLIGVAAFWVAGCSGTITGLEINPNAVRDPYLLRNQVRYGSVVEVVVDGTGTCDNVFLDWGDGSPQDSAANVTFTAAGTGPSFQHRYFGWLATYPVTASGTNCSNTTATIGVGVAGPTVSGGLAADWYNRVRIPGVNMNWRASACNPAVPWNAASYPMPALPGGTLVWIDTDHHYSNLVDFGCAPASCIHDPGGEQGSSAPASFPFPGYRKYSLVARLVGINPPQLVQGDTNRASFITTLTGGTLELCVNDDNLADNSGYWYFEISFPFGLGHHQ